MHRASTVLILSLGFALACAAFVAAGASAQQPGGDPEARKVQNPVPANAESIAAGQKLYQRNCQFCHGPEGVGDGPLAPPGVEVGNLVDGEWSYGSSDGELFAVIANGIGPDFNMPGIKGRVPDNDIWHIINFIRSIGPDDAETR